MADDTPYGYEFDEEGFMLNGDACLPKSQNHRILQLKDNRNEYFWSIPVETTYEEEQALWYVEVYTKILKEVFKVNLLNNFYYFC